MTDKTFGFDKFCDAYNKAKTVNPDDPRVYMIAPGSYVAAAAPRTDALGGDAWVPIFGTNNRMGRLTWCIGDVAHCVVDGIAWTVFVSDPKEASNAT